MGRGLRLVSGDFSLLTLLRLRRFVGCVGGSELYLIYVSCLGRIDCWIFFALTGCKYNFIICSTIFSTYSIRLFFEFPKVRI